jgi:hypothetical protein
MSHTAITPHPVKGIRATRAQGVTDVGGQRSPIDLPSARLRKRLV